MFIVTTKEGGRVNGQLSNTVFQVASEPPIISIAINRDNISHGMISRSGTFTVSVLDTTATLSLIRGFGFRHGGSVNKFVGVPYREGRNGAPIVSVSTNAYIEARVIGSVEARSHTVFLGEVTDMGLLGDGVSMTYDFYHYVIKGRTPPSAPTYIPPPRREDAR
jgi:flavin reductase (DIM6/NTAB) family NADH-FMN oxidoreductase RutF